MDAPKKILIDTNIVIHLEDNKQIRHSYSTLNRVCGENGIQIVIHESSYEDVLADLDQDRKEISLSKLDKYPKISKNNRTKQQKETDFGPVTSRNDDVDTDLLVSLKYRLVDLLISEDSGIKKRVKDSDELYKRVLNVKEVLSLFDGFFGCIEVEYQHVQDKLCDQYDHADPFFNSLRKDYDFEGWYAKCMREQRKCWVIEHENKISGLIIYKDELNHDELNNLCVPGNKVLKICLFKTEGVKGEKYGEQLLKTEMDFAYRNKYDSAFLTVFPKHEGLIRLIGKFGFVKGKPKDGEESYYKLTKVLEGDEDMPPFEFHKKYWPCVKGTGVKIFCIPIKPEFHARLFPESDQRISPPIRQMSLGFEGAVSQTPGNAIRKIYICNAPLKEMSPGSMLLFYRSKDSLLTSVGVLEEYFEIEKSEELIKVAGNRSVYSIDELLEMASGKVKAKAVNFYYAANFEDPIALADLRKYDILKAGPQSIVNMSDKKFFKLYEKLLSEKDKEVFFG